MSYERGVDMEFLQLKYFQTVARYEHITKSAEKLNISQPALSIMISRLEEEIGTPLFSRTGRNIKLNEFGKVFLTHVDSIFCELENSRVEIKDMLNMKDNNIRIATTNTTFLSDILKDFLSICSEIKIKQSLNLKDIIEEQMRAGEIDLAITFPPIENNDIECVKLWEDEVVLVVQKNHKFANRKYVNLSEAANESFIALAHSYSYRNFTDSLCNEAGFSPNVIFEVDYLLMYDMAQLGRGMALIPESVCKKYEDRYPYLNFIKIKNPNCKMEISMSWLKGRYLSKAAESFKNFVIDYVKNMH
jgi:DNA-binding transcriptional LysR family regulator